MAKSKRDSAISVTETDERRKMLAKLKLKQIDARSKERRRESRLAKLKGKAKDLKKGKEGKKQKRKLSEIKEKKQTISKKEAKAEAQRKSIGQKIKKKSVIKKHVKATPGVKTPPVPAFLTGDDLIAQGAATTELEDTLREIDFALEDQRIATEAEKGAISKAELQKTTNAQEQLAARGLSRSSIRDAELFDIEATASLRRKFLDDQLSTAALRAPTLKTAAKAAFDRFKLGMDQKAVENAAAVSEGMPEYTVDPTKARTARQRVRLPQGAGKKGLKKLINRPTRAPEGSVMSNYDEARPGRHAGV